jgi:hypothetical protein
MIQAKALPRGSVAIAMAKPAAKPSAKPVGPLIRVGKARSHPYVVSSDQGQQLFEDLEDVIQSDPDLDNTKVYIMNLQQHCDKYNLADFIIDETGCGADGLT